MYSTWAFPISFAAKTALDLKRPLSERYRIGYAPVWDEDGKRLRLRFRYLDEPHQGRFVGDTEPGPEITSYLEPLTLGGFVARDAIMKRVAAAGHCGWYAVRMSEFIVDHMHAGHVAREDARDKGASTWG